MDIWKQAIASLAFIALAAIHSPPVEAPISDPFRAPEHAYGSGNRGIEYDTEPGQPILASAGGVVTFAGQVGGNLFVTVDHGDGLLTTVGYVGDVIVVRGQAVRSGDSIAVAGERLHFSARLDGIYIDPALLFAGFEVKVRLVADPDG